MVFLIMADTILATDFRRTEIWASVTPAPIDRVPPTSVFRPPEILAMISTIMRKVRNIGALYDWFGEILSWTYLTSLIKGSSKALCY